MANCLYLYRGSMSTQLSGLDLKKKKCEKRMDVVERSICFERNPISNLTLPWRLIKSDSIGALATDDRRRREEAGEKKGEKRNGE